MIKVKTLKMLKALPNEPKDKEQAYIEEEDSKYIYDASQQDWIKKPKTAPINTHISLYDMNKQFIAQLLPLTDDMIETKKPIVEDYILNSSNYNFMLMCKELSYYTIILTGYEEEDPAVDIIIECAKNVGQIKSIELNENNAVEIWVDTGRDNCLLLLFEYDEGVVLCQ